MIGSENGSCSPIHNHRGETIGFGGLLLGMAKAKVSELSGNPGFP